jgi:hypothetical protein
MEELLEVLQSVFARPLITVGGTPVTLGSVIYVVALVVALFIVAGWLRHLVSGRLLKRSRLDPGARQAAGAITRYIVLLTGLLALLSGVLWRERSTWRRAPYPWLMLGLYGVVLLGGLWSSASWGDIQLNYTKYIKLLLGAVFFVLLAQPQWRRLLQRRRQPPFWTAEQGSCQPSMSPHS